MLILNPKLGATKLILILSTDKLFKQFI